LSTDAYESIIDDTFGIGGNGHGGNGHGGNGHGGNSYGDDRR
jgi:hypothetical protein